ncbi:MAG: hypothetical protein HRT35_03240 [Algicola sp.]|nr:hypothetical protein [Algicola sp.]
MQALIKILTLLCLVSTGFTTAADNILSPQLSSFETHLKLPVEELQGDELHIAVSILEVECKINRCNITGTQLLQLLDKAENVRFSDDYITVRRLVRMILSHGGEDDYQKLLYRSSTLARDSTILTEYLNGLSRYWLTREMKALVAGPKPDSVTFPLTNEPIPEHLSTASDELKKAWRMYHSLMFAFDDYLKQNEADKISAQHNWAGFNGVIAKFLLGEQQDTVKAMAPYVFGGMCGTGSQRITMPKNRTVMMSLLQQRRYDLAVGALLKYKQGDWNWGSGEQFELYRQFFDFVGVNWQTLYVGAVLNEHYYYLKELAEFGTEDTVEYLLAMGALPSVRSKQRYLDIIAGFIEPGGPVDKFSSTASPSQQKALLGVIVAATVSHADLDGVRWMNDLLGRLRRPETKEALYAILKGPYLKPAQKAAITLNAMGEKVVVPADPKPVQFRVLVNGKLQASAPIELEISYPKGTIQNGFVTSIDGIFEVDRDTLYADRESTTLTVASSGKLKTPQDAFFATQITPPEESDGIFTLDIMAPSLIFNLDLDALPDSVRAKEASIILNYSGNKMGVNHYFSQLSDDVKAKVTSQITFLSVAMGKYNASILIPGVAMWYSSAFEVGEEAKEVDVVLSPGRDLKVLMSLPNVEFELKKANGHSIWPVRYDWFSKSYRGLALGQYKLVILRGSELRKIRPVSGSIYTGPDFAGQEIDITLDESTSELVDLGVIELQ